MQLLMTSVPKSNNPVIELEQLLYRKVKEK